MRIGWLVNGDRFVMTSPFRNFLHLPTTQCACAEFLDFAKQLNGGGGREKDLCRILLVLSHMFGYVEQKLLGR
jgi:hypothetical protein